MWSRVWQMACHESEIPDAGDHVVYDIGDESLLVTRLASGEIRAHHNTCLHRGNCLRTDDGCAERFIQRGDSGTPGAARVSTHTA